MLGHATSGGRRLSSGTDRRRVVRAWPGVGLFASVICTSALLLHPPAPLHAQKAQQPTTLEPGDRIRVSVVTPTPRLYIGAYQARTDSTLQLESGGSPLAIAMRTVT